MKKKLIGQIVSNKMPKTVVVKVERIKEHPRYKRRYKTHKKYKAHMEKGEGKEDKSSFSPFAKAREYKVGDKVVIEECRPISKEKRWKVIKKVDEAKDSS